MSGMNMDELVAKLLTDPKAREEWMQVAKRLEEKHPAENKKEPPVEKKKVYTVVKREADADCCRLSFEDGYSLCFTPDAGQFLEHTDETSKASKSLKTIQEEKPVVFESFMKSHRVDIQDLMFVVTHMGFMFSREAVKAFDRHKKVVAEAEQKTRYIAQDKKRAFMAGLVCGRNP